MNEAEEDVVVANEPSLLVKVATTVWFPTVSPVAVAEATPLFTVAGARLLPSTEKTTVPTGVPSGEEISAVRVTLWPKMGDAGEKGSSVTVTGNGELSPVWTISRFGGVANAAFAAFPLKVAVFEKVVADVGVN